MVAQHVQRHNIERAQMRGGQVHPRRAALIRGLQEPRGTEAPRIARLEPGKAEFGARGAEIVTDIFRIGQKFVGHYSTYSVAPLIFGACIAKPIAEKPANR